MKFAVFEQIKKSLESVKRYALGEIGNVANATVEAVEEIAGELNNKADKPHYITVVIPTEGWQSDDFDYPQYYDIAVEGITENDRTDVILAIESMKTAAECGFCNVTETLEGKIRVRAMSVPKDVITTEIRFNTNCDAVNIEGVTIVELQNGLNQKANVLHSHSADDITGGTISDNIIIQGNLNIANDEKNNKISFQTNNYITMNANNQMEIKAPALNFLVNGTVTHKGVELAKVNFANVTKETIENKLTCKGGFSNVALGENTLKENGIGSKNTAIGANALQKNKGGYDNTAIGSDVLKENIAGNNNTAVGCSVLESNTEGNYNTGVGTDALNANTTGKQNAAFGHNAMQSNTTGEGNTAVGTYALLENTTGKQNTAVGFMSLFGCVSYNNCAGLGYGSQVTGSNQIQLGDSSVTVYAQKAVVTRSDARDKIDIEDSPLGLNFILKLRPCKYRMNSREAYFEKGKKRDFTATNDGSKAGKRPHYGLIAQEVKEAMNELNVDFAGYLDSNIDGGEDVLSLGYTEFIAPMIKAIQEQQRMIEELQKQVDVLKQKINEVV